MPLGEGRRVAASIERLAPMASVDFRSYTGMGHATCAEQVADLRAFLQSVVAGTPAAATPTAATPAAAPAATAPATLEAMSTGRLKAYLRERGVSSADCFERTDLLTRALESSRGFSSD